MTDYIRGEVALPDNLNMLAGRCGDRDRQRTADHLNDMYARGYLDEAECRRRVEIALKAPALKDLEYLTTDLPALPMPKVHDRPLRVRLLEDQKPLTAMLQFITAFLGIGLAVVPWAATAHIDGSVLVNSLGATATVVGTLIIVLSVVWAAHTWD
jgi:hypothetical protein